ncbi:hypothetical protein [Nesterenkonia suensis]
MAQPFGIGDVVGGRYRITHHVVTSADQDIVFQGIDQVLNREVSILLASTQNAKQVATSAKELATGERSSEVQVLDLGLAEDRTYLISTLTHPNDLLDLVVPDAAPYVEPFFTDSLGSELFGQSRVMEPETFHDDAEYYAGLQEVAPGAEEEPGDSEAPSRRRRPAFLGRVSESLNRRLGTHRDADRLQQAPAGASPAEGSPAEPSSTDVSPSGAVFSGAAEPGAVSPDSAGGPFDQSADGGLDLHADREIVEPRPEADAGEEFGVALDEAGQWRPVSTVVGPDAGSSPAGATDAHEDAIVEDRPAEGPALDDPAPQRPTISDEDDGEEVIDDPPDEPVPAESSSPSAGLGAVAGPSFTGLISAVPEERRSAFPAGPSGGAYAATAADAPALDADDADDQPASAPVAGRSGNGRWIGVGVLAVVVLLAAVAGFFMLRGGDEPAPAADDEQTTQPEEAETEAAPQEEPEEEPGEEPEADTEPQEDEDEAEADGPAPITAVTRLVPESPQLNEATDGQLSNTFDGDTSTTWNSFLYGSAEFGGLVSEFALVVELEESSPVSAVTLTQQGQVEGGSFQVLVNDSPSLDGAEQIGAGTWNWTETTVELDDAEGQYVIINTTALPERLAPDNPDLPYGLELAQIVLE